MIDDSKLLGLTVAIVMSYVGANRLRAGELASLIRTVHDTLSSLTHPHHPLGPSSRKRSPSQVRASIRPRGLVSFQDRRTYQLLRRRREA
jgi:predicted transcriptional regulator